MQIQNHALVLVAGTVLLIDPQISPSQRQAAIDSTLYAQLVANKRAGNRFTEPATWDRTYRAVYSELGWLVTSQAHDEQSVPGVAGLAISPALQAWFGQAGIDGAQVLRSVFESLREHPDGLRQLQGFIRSDTADGHLAKLEIGLMDADMRLHLCSLSWQSTAAVEAAEQPSLSEIATLPAEVQLRCLSLLCDAQSFETKRSQLRMLMDKKQHENAYVLELPTQNRRM